MDSLEKLVDLARSIQAGDSHFKKEGMFEG